MTDLNLKENLKERHSFNAEVSKVLHLVIHSLYTNKDIFLRELISNASDALDKLNYLSISKPDLLAEDPDLKIKITAEKDKNKLIIQDSGIGMSREELQENLGTVARSGTQRFLQVLDKDAQKKMDLIGQFGVGFYSVFMVANRVIVESRKADSDENGWIWTSDGVSDFVLEPAEERLPRGTKITIFLRPEEGGYADRFKIEHIVQSYSNHIQFPIEYTNEKGEVEQLNSAAAIWTKPKGEITDKEHQDFFRSVAHVGGEPWMIMHNKSEGMLSYTTLLYIPSIRPFDLFHPDRKCATKLYVKRVFITEDNVQVVPQYLRFLRGIVDSEDLPLNISRETLQHSTILTRIRESITKRTLEGLVKRAEKDPEDYKKFWNNFGAVLREGLCEGMNTESREKLMGVCRFNSTVAGEDLVSLDQYIAGMQKNQKAIYYLIGDSLDLVKKSPQLEGFISRNIEVILLCDAVDNFWTNVVNEYKNVPLKSVTASDIDFDEIGGQENSDEKETGAEKPKENEVKDFIGYIKEILGEKVSEVRVSKKLKDSPACLAVKEGGMDIRMERFLMEQRQLNRLSAKIFEINLSHPIWLKLLAKHKEAGESEEIVACAKLLFSQACIIEGENVPDVYEFARYMSDVLLKIMV
ncbi:chaperone protein HtpG [Rickettsiales bacterium]|nr:chaperone protein HtpG [Rickettsiales bacterium]